MLNFIDLIVVASYCLFMFLFLPVQLTIDALKLDSLLEKFLVKLSDLSVHEICGLASA